MPSLTALATTTERPCACGVAGCAGDHDGEGVVVVLPTPPRAPSAR